MLDRMGSRLGRARIAAMIVVALGALLLASGPRGVSAYRELRCPEGEGARPLSVAPVFQCSAIPPGVNAWPNMVVLEDRTALYLANIGVRVFDIDRAWGTSHFLAWNVPAPDP
jgi:hypothetical protein